MCSPMVILPYSKPSTGSLSHAVKATALTRTLQLTVLSACHLPGHIALPAPWFSSDLGTLLGLHWLSLLFEKLSSQRPAQRASASFRRYPTTLAEICFFPI